VQELPNVVVLKRREIVKEVIAGVERLRESTSSLQVVVTSRPTAFANSPGFPEKAFPHFELVSLTRQLIDDYADRWLRARKLRDRESADVRKILKEKLDQPHLRDLARNPMQLAILLSLIHTRGSSLPDKRTALYDSYVDLFFSREAEKSSVVREQRNLLIDIHRYVAWSLHSAAEQGQSRGSISSERLQRLLAEYLAEEGYDSSLSEKLFAGMVERVVFLVARVEGLFEFEVQPLREYFAARHLYETAPYSPPGAERRGTKPDRFDAIARDFYWLNVARFYAGCFSKGELPSLTDRLQELARQDGYRNTSHPRILAAMLLSDWVFEQHPKSMKEVVTLVLDGLGLRYILSSTTQRQGPSSSLVLPKNCGRDELLEKCFNILHNRPAPDFAGEVTSLIEANATSAEIKELWYKEILKVNDADRTRWLSYGLRLGSLSELTVGELEGLLADDPIDPARLKLIFRAKQVAYCESHESRCDVVIHSIMDGEISVQAEQRVPSILAMFAQSLDARRYAQAFISPEPIPLPYIWRYPPRRISATADEVQLDCANPLLGKCLAVVKVVESEIRRTANDWATTLAPWDAIVEESRLLWGEQWAHYRLANVACGIKSSKETCTDAPNLLDESVSLCRRARYARLRAGAPDWWRRQINAATNRLDDMFLSLVLLTWASASTLVAVADTASPVFERLCIDDWQRVIAAVEQALRLARGQANDGLLSLDTGSLPDNLNDRAVAAIGLRATEGQANNLYLRYLYGYHGSDPVVLEFCQKAVLDLVRHDASRWRQTLEIVRKIYAEGVMPRSYIYHQFVRNTDTSFLPIDIAKEITEQAELYPHPLVLFAEARCREEVASAIIPVGVVAAREGWFPSEANQYTQGNRI